MPFSIRSIWIKLFLIANSHKPRVNKNVFDINLIEIEVWHIDAIANFIKEIVVSELNLDFMVTNKIYVTAPGGVEVLEPTALMHVLIGQPTCEHHNMLFC